MNRIQRPTGACLQGGAPFLTALALVAFAPTAGAQAQAGIQSGVQSKAADETAACACTCAACLAKHGKKPVVKELKPLLFDVTPVLSEEQPASIKLEIVEVDVEVEEEPIVEDFFIEEVTEVDVNEVDVMEPFEPTVVEVSEAIDASRAADGTFRAKVIKGKDGNDTIVYLPGSDVREDFFAGTYAEMRPKAPANAPGYLGVELRDGDDGVTIGNVIPGSPAGNAGVQAGDIVFNFGGATIVTFDELRGELAKHSAGDSVSVGVMRSGKPQQIEVSLGDRTAMRGASRPALEDVTLALPAPKDSLLQVDPRSVPVPDGLAPAAKRRTVKVELPTETPEVAAPRVPEGLRVQLLEPSFDVASDKPAQLRWKLNPPKAAIKSPTATQRIPEGYVEVVERRVLRPAEGGGADAAKLRAQLDALRAEIAILTKEVDAMKRELNRRNPR